MSSIPSFSPQAIVVIAVVGSVIVFLILGLLIIVVHQRQRLKRLQRNLEAYSWIHDDMPPLPTETRLARPKLVSRFKHCPSRRLDWDAPIAAGQLGRTSMSEKSWVKPQVRWVPSITGKRYNRNLARSWVKPEAPDCLKAPVDSGSEHDHGILPTGLSSSPSPPPSLSDEHGWRDDRKHLQPSAVPRPHAKLRPPPLFSQGPRLDMGNNDAIETSGPTDSGAEWSDHQSHLPHLQTPCRSLSRRSRLGQAPCIPIPPLPPISATLSDLVGDSPSTRECTSVASERNSVSTIESISSSLLAASPRQNQSGSPRLVKGANHYFRNSLIMGPRAIQKAKSVHMHALSLSGQKSLKSPRSMHSHQAQYSETSLSSISELKSKPVSCLAPSVIPLLFPSSARNQFTNGGSSDGEIYPASVGKREVECRRPDHRASDPPTTMAMDKFRLSDLAPQEDDTNSFCWQYTPTKIGRATGSKRNRHSRHSTRRASHMRRSMSQKTVDWRNPPVVSDNQGGGSGQGGRDGDVDASSPRIQTQTTSFPETPCTANNSHQPRIKTRSLPRPPSTCTIAPDIELDDTIRSRPRTCSPAPERLGSIASLRLPSLSSVRSIQRTTNQFTLPFPFESTSGEQKDQIPVEFEFLAQPMEHQSLPYRSPETASLLASGSTTNGALETTKQETRAERDLGPECVVSDEAVDEHNGSASADMHKMYPIAEDPIEIADGDLAAREPSPPQTNPPERRSLLASITTLRRMNSEADSAGHDAHRYFRLQSKAHTAKAPFARHGSAPVGYKAPIGGDAAWPVRLRDTTPEDALVQWDSEVDLMLKDDNDKLTPPPQQNRVLPSLTHKQVLQMSAQPASPIDESATLPSPSPSSPSPSFKIWTDPHGQQATPAINTNTTVGASPLLWTLAALRASEPNSRPSSGYGAVGQGCKMRPTLDNNTVARESFYDENGIYIERAIS